MPAAATNLHHDLSRVLTRLDGLGVMRREPAQGWRFLVGAFADERAAARRFRLLVKPAAPLEPGFAPDPAFARTMREAHAAFHLGLARGAGNRFLAAAVEHRNDLRRLINDGHRFDDGEAHRTCREHLAILDAPEADDAPGAAALLRSHIRRAGP